MRDICFYLSHWTWVNLHFNNKYLRLPIDNTRYDWITLEDGFILMLTLTQWSLVHLNTPWTRYV